MHACAVAADSVAEFGNFSAGDAHACKRAGFCQAAHQIVDGLAVELVDIDDVGDVGRLESSRREVVRDHGYKVVAQGIVDACALCELNFGADAIGGDANALIAEKKEVGKSAVYFQSRSSCFIGAIGKGLLGPAKCVLGT